MKGYRQNVKTSDVLNFACTKSIVENPAQEETVLSFRELKRDKTSKSIFDILKTKKICASFDKRVVDLITKKSVPIGYYSL